jgi:hypothetical protein
MTESLPITEEAFSFFALWGTAAILFLAVGHLGL